MSEREGMMEYTLCMDCDYCMTDRKNEQGQVRCRRFSWYVNRNDKSCDEFYNDELYGEDADRFFRLFKPLEDRRKAMSEWHDITTAMVAPSGYKKQCDRPMFVKDEDGKYVRNKEYEQRLVNIGDVGVDRMLKDSVADRRINIDGQVVTDNESSFIERLIIARAKEFDKAIMGTIEKIVEENAIETRVLLNEAFIVEAIRNRTPVLPRINEDSFYCCPTCGGSIDKSKKYCGSCGQAIDWRSGGEGK